MDDFSTKPGRPNEFGLVGATANAIAPNKRSLSSMSPTFVETPKGLMIIGSPGGSFIISMVLLGHAQLSGRHERGGHREISALPPSIPARRSRL